MTAVKRGVRTYVIDEVPIESRDFTGGKATALMADLKKAGAIFIKHPSRAAHTRQRNPRPRWSCLSSQDEIPGHMKDASKAITQTSDKKETN